MTGEPLFLAFETGGTKLVTGIAGVDRRIVKSATVRRGPADRAPESMHRILAASENLVASVPGARRRLKAIGFGFGGTVRRSSNTPHLCLHEDGWEEVDVVGELTGRFGVPVFVENDCKLAALAEAHFGAGQGARSLFYITLGTGVGGGFVLGGEIVACGDLGEAEIGHIVVEPGGPRCCCGNRGCVEALCSGPGLAKLCRFLCSRHPREWKSSDLSSEADDAAIDSVRIVQSWVAGDPFARLVVEYSMERLAAALAATVNLLVPERVVVGGGLGTSNSRLLDLLDDRVRPLVVPYFRDGFTLVASQLRESVVTQGAVILAAQRADRERMSSQLLE